MFVQVRLGFLASLWFGISTPHRKKERTVIILGLILLIIGLVASIAILKTIGIILLVIGLILALIGALGNGIGGRKHWY
jgi:uncharacterized membrane protein HdeD (DUF308 family)